MFSDSETIDRPQIASTADPSMLRQILVAVTRATGSRSAWLERYHDGVSGAEVVVSHGPDAPAPGVDATGYALALHDALAFPLVIDDKQIGAIVCVDVPHAVALDPTAPGQIELLGTLAAAALRNMTLVRELELATSEAVERRFKLVNGLVHYLKNTLGAAGEYVQLLELESAMTARQREFIDASQRNIEVAIRLLNELLDLGRVETGRLQIDPEPIDPAVIVRGIVRDYELLNATSGVHFVHAMADRLPMIHTDVDLMRKILDTLLSNAVKYTPPGGSVRVGAEVRAGRRAGDPQSWVCITVRDEGPGVTERDQVFEEIVRAESATTPGFRLAICRRIARLLGGDLSLDTRDGAGSSFALWLPTDAEESALTAQHNSALERADVDLRTTLAE